ncbi:MAG: methionine--tRNA ligase subunit beta, partial [Sinomicrobium sp.]|nr:methionine--tRNA ligase subunit beta [Sinomicrobium sp.]
IIFPCLLKAYGGYILPDNVPANEFLNLEGNKLSTSKNWAVWLHEYLEDFPGGQDVLRYVLTTNAPETKDNDFTWKDFQARNNNELVAVFGNFINRVMVLTHKYYDGVVPQPGVLHKVDTAVLEALRLYPGKIGDSIAKFRFREALQELMNLARTGNKYLADEEPWKLIKTDEARVKTIMFTALQISAALAVLSEPFLPFTSAKLMEMLRFVQHDKGDVTLHAKSTEGSVPFPSWNGVAGKSALLSPGWRIGAPKLLFSKIEDGDIQKQLEKLQTSKRENEAAKTTVVPRKDECTFDDFARLDIRTGTILEAEKMPKADKLLVLKVDTGMDVRTIVSGIAGSFSPEELTGKKVSVVVNLATRTLRGVKSEGMILMAETPEGRLVFVNPDSDGVENGAVIC